MSTMTKRFILNRPSEEPTICDGGRERHWRPGHSPTLSRLRLLLLGSIRKARGRSHLFVVVNPKAALPLPRKLDDGFLLLPYSVQFRKFPFSTRLEESGFLGGKSSRINWMHFCVCYQAKMIVATPAILFGIQFHRGYFHP